MPIRYRAAAGVQSVTSEAAIHARSEVPREDLSRGGGRSPLRMEPGVLICLSDVTDGIGVGGVGLLDGLDVASDDEQRTAAREAVGWLPRDASTTAGGSPHVPGISRLGARSTGRPRRSPCAHEIAHTHGENHSDLTTGGRHWFDLQERKIQAAFAGGRPFWLYARRGCDVRCRELDVPPNYYFLFGKLCSGAAAESLENSTGNNRRQRPRIGFRQRHSAADRQPQSALSDFHRADIHSRSALGGSRLLRQAQERPWEHCSVSTASTSRSRRAAFDDCRHARFFRPRGSLSRGPRAGRADSRDDHSHQLPYAERQPACRNADLSRTRPGSPCRGSRR